jgi:hypothetical protein
MTLRRGVRPTRLNSQLAYARRLTYSCHFTIPLTVRYKTMPIKNTRIRVALLAGLIWAPLSLPDVGATGAIAFAQDSAASPAAQAAPATPSGMAPVLNRPLGPGFLTVKGHPLLMPYPACATLIQRTMWGEQVTITDAPCKAKLQEAQRIDRTEPDSEGVPTLNGSRPEDQSPPHAPAERAP